MADNGLSAVVGGTARGVGPASRPAGRAAAAAGTVASVAPVKAVAATKGGNGGARRALVNVDGQVLDRTAPRGTYLDITA